jgi:predicted dehydrogenase
MINVALIGTGYWGKVYIKTLKNIKNIDLTTYTHNYKQILIDKNIDCVIIATPVETHFEIVKNCLLAEKHILVEKPFTDNSHDALELFKLSKKVNKILLVGHIYLYHNGIIQLKEMVDEGIFGNNLKIYTKRMCLLNNSLNALWELASHDIYILDYIFNSKIKKIKVLGDTKYCYIYILYANKVEAFIEVSSCYFKKIREITVIGSLKTAMFNDSSIIIFNKTHDKETYIDNKISPLEKQCRYFFDCILNNKQPIINAYDGYKNIKILEKINKLL